MEKRNKEGKQSSEEKETSTIMHRVTRDRRVMDESGKRRHGVPRHGRRGLEEGAHKSRLGRGMVQREQEKWRDVDGVVWEGVDKLGTRRYSR